MSTRLQGIHCSHIFFRRCFPLLWDHPLDQPQHVQLQSAVSSFLFHPWINNLDNCVCCLHLLSMARLLCLPRSFGVASVHVPRIHLSEGLTRPTPSFPNKSCTRHVRVGEWVPKVLSPRGACNTAVSGPEPLGIHSWHVQLPFSAVRHEFLA